MGGIEDRLASRCSHGISLGEEGRGEAWRQEWGDSMPQSPKGAIWVMFLNTVGLPLDSKEVKNKRLLEYIQTNRVDIMGLMECNVNWKALDIQDCLPMRTKGWFESLHMNTAYFQEFYQSGSGAKSQVGGVSLWVVNKTAHHVAKNGWDSSGMGRWAWMKLQGRGGITT